MAGLSVFFELLVAHALADFALQGEAMGSGKNRHNKIHDNAGKHFPAWQYWLTAHSLVHGGAVYLVTGSLLLGVVETVLHSLIDFCKCEGWINFHVDQGLHVACKIGYCVFLLSI
jgi:hypothetical protein